MTVEVFGRTQDGRAVTRHTLERGSLRVRVISYGGCVTSVECPGGVTTSTSGDRSSAQRAAIAAACS